MCAVSYSRPPQWWRYLGLMKTAVRHVDAFISPSLFSANIHRQMGLTVPIVHIPNFVSSGEPPAEDRLYDNRSDTSYFLFAGRLEKLKGLHTLIPVFRRYKKAQLWIAGSGDYERRLRQMAEGVSNIRFLGHKNKLELQTLYQQAIAVIVPSIAYEASPLVTFEAFSQQTPVIVRNLGAMPEAIQESGGGCVYNTDEELLAAMDQLCGDVSRRNQLGLRGYQGLQQNWTADAHLKRYFELIDQIAVARGQPFDQRICQLSPISLGA
jgi:glycosyltransferase involved in cell wall biosynthesis